MELDYIDNYNGLHENIVRLFDFNKAEAIQFRDLIQNVVIEQKQKLDLSQIDFINTEDYNLIFGLFKTDEGILTKDYRTFFCILTLNGFKEMLRLLAPFCVKDTKAHQYLYDLDTPTDLLFAPYATAI
ncbi:hypothetical protein [uncultured Polaribacter sp.]|uniref:hypothetical protein n=1 Tax=uncultured Polaribacter sp. TaxID=174711 RepID=UPI0026023588|nr:hypothetical protein [uncultured Polaribacter sp.]